MLGLATSPAKEKKEEDESSGSNYLDFDYDGILEWETDQTDQQEDQEETEETEKTEKPRLTAVSFIELASLLASKGINLQEELDNHIAFMLRHGAVLQEQDREAYGAKFQTLHVQKEELENIPQGWRPILFVDDMTPVQAAKKFITDTGIDLREWADLFEFQKVNPKTQKPYKNQTPSNLARLTFTPDIANLTTDLTGKNDDYHLEQIKKGKRYLQPQQWFQLFAKGLQKAMKELHLGNGKPWKDLTTEEKQEVLNKTRIDQYLPNNNVTWTQCLDWRNEEGRMLRLGWNPSYRRVEVDDIHSQKSAYGGLGPRPVLG